METRETIHGERDAFTGLVAKVVETGTVLAFGKAVESSESASRNATAEQKRSEGHLAIQQAMTSSRVSSMSLLMWDGGGGMCR